MYLFTSESVSEDTDKIADQISDALIDNSWHLMPTLR
jgi:S-adenosylmethionine synthetase